MAGLTVSALMAWPHKYLFPILQSVVLSMPNTSFPTVLTAAPDFLPGLVRGGWCLNHGPLVHRCLHRRSCIFHQSDHLDHHQILRRSYGAVPLSFFDPDPRSYLSVSCEIPDLRRRQMFDLDIVSWTP